MTYKIDTTTTRNSSLDATGTASAAGVVYASYDALEGNTYYNEAQYWVVNSFGSFASTTFTWNSSSNELTGSGVTGLDVAITTQSVSVSYSGAALNGPTYSYGYTSGATTTTTVMAMLPGCTPPSATTQTVGGETPVQTWWDWLTGQAQTLVMDGVNAASAAASKATQAGEQLLNREEKGTSGKKRGHRRLFAYLIYDVPFSFPVGRQPGACSF